MECFQDVISKEQCGFMPGKSTLDAAKKFHAKITETITGPGTKFFAIFIDLTTVFDLLDRTILVNKIIEKKLPKTELKLIYRMYKAYISSE
jgi:retron-type reverse transcriptase